MHMPDAHGPVVITPIAVGAPVTGGDDLARTLLDALAASSVALQHGDVVVVASKVVAITEGGLLPAGAPAAAGEPGGWPHDDPRRAAARSQAARIVADAPRALVVATHHGYVCANAGIDVSNVAEGMLLLPQDPDTSAASLRAALHGALGVDVAVVVTDTFGRPWRMGQVDVALGVAGMTPLRDERGTTDLHGRHLDVTVAAIGDEVAAAADLVRSKASRVPFVVVRGLQVAGPGSGADLVRPLDEDLFPAGGPTLFEHAVTHAPVATSPAPTSEDVLALLARAVRALRRPDVVFEVRSTPAPAVAVVATSAMRAGMAAEALRILLAGHHVLVRVDEVALERPVEDGEALVRAVVVPEPGRGAPG